MTIPVLPAAPQQIDPANWRARGDLFFPALTNFSISCNEFSTQFLTAVQDVNNAVVASVWATGAYTAGQRAYDPTNGLLYLCILNHTGTAGQYPSTQPTRWTLMSVTMPPLTNHSAATSSGSPKALPRNAHTELSNSAQSFARLPGTADSYTPAVGDWLIVGFSNGRYDNVIQRNGYNIRGAAEDLTVNALDCTLFFRYLGAPYGWKWWAAT